MPLKSFHISSEYSLSNGRSKSKHFIIFKVLIDQTLPKIIVDLATILFFTKLSIFADLLNTLPYV